MYSPVFFEDLEREFSVVLVSSFVKGFHFFLGRDLEGSLFYRFCMVAGGASFHYCLFIDDEVIKRKTFIIGLIHHHFPRDLGATEAFWPVFLIKPLEIALIGVFVGKVTLLAEKLRISLVRHGVLPFLA